MQAWGTYDMWKGFLGMWHSQLTEFFFLFLLPNQHLYIVMNVCTYMYEVSDCVKDCI